VGHTYANISRLFLRLFTGLIFLQLSVRQMMHFDEAAAAFPALFGLTPETTLMAVVMIEIICAVLLMLGFLMRVAIVVPLLLMVLAQYAITVYGETSSYIFSCPPGYPLMFIGIFIYLLLAGPGKISLDYIIAVNLIENKDDVDIVENA